jgi:large subunit ribosomal protein L21
MYAIIECGGKQYRVSEGDVLKVEKLNAAVGSTITIDRVLMLGGDKIYVGAPLVGGAVVSCKVLNHDQEKKILVFHYKAKKNIRKRYGHRQPYTSLLVENISRDENGAQPVKTEVPKPVETETAVVTEAKPVAKTVAPEQLESTAVTTEKPVKKATTTKKVVASTTDTEKPIKKTAGTKAKKTETAATAEAKPVKKTTRAKKTTETEG